MQTKNTVVIIGASTGGFKIVRKIFSGLPVLNAGIIIVQHMLGSVNGAFKEKLNGNTEMEVKIAEDGDGIEAGKVYIAPSGLHLRLIDNRKIGLINDGKVNSVRPSIDVTMKSLKSGPEGGIIGVILTGMGKDGVEGISHIKSIGGITIAQDRDTSAIYGMPKAAVETGDVDFALTPEEISDKLIEVVGITKG